MAQLNTEAMEISFLEIERAPGNQCSIRTNQKEMKKLKGKRIGEDRFPILEYFN
jgi:hypothetical protein